MRHARHILSEAAIVAMTGLAIAFVANALSPRGLELRRDYFPKLLVTGVSTTSNPVVESTITTTNTTPALTQHGLPLVKSNHVAQMFRDPQYEQGIIVFVDARDDVNYKAGHIPGAWQLDRYHAENYLPTVLPVCLGAQRVVVYCTGGDCDDSDYAAALLREAGVPAEKLFVYAGGITEWKENGLPVETGPRNHGGIPQQ